MEVNMFFDMILGWIRHSATTIGGGFITYAATQGVDEATLSALTSDFNAVVGFLLIVGGAAASALAKRKEKGE